MSDNSAKSKPKFTRNIGTNCMVRLSIYSKVQYNSKYSREDGIDEDTEISSAADVSHNHEMLKPDAIREKNATVELLSKISKSLNDGLEGRAIIRSLRLLGDIKTESQAQECWRHLYSLAKNSGSIRGADELENAFVHIKSNDGIVKIDIATVGGNSFPRVITWATADQIALAQSGIADVLAMDATYGLLQCGMPFVQVAVQTAPGKVIPLVQAVVFNEQIGTYCILLQHISEILGRSRIKTIFTDADPALIKAIAETLDVKHFLCRYHKRMNIRTAAAGVSKDDEQIVIKKLVDHGLLKVTDRYTDKSAVFVKLCVIAFNNVIYTRNITDYNKVKLALIESFPFSIQSRIRSVFNSEEQFAELYTYTWRRLGWETSSAAESTHSALKKWLKNRSTNRLSFDDFVQEDCKFIENRIAKVNARVQHEMTWKIYNLPIGFIHEASGKIPRKVANNVYASYLASKKEYKANVSTDKPDIWNVHKIDSRNAITGHMADYIFTKVACNIIDGLESWKCSCFKYEREGLPCVHIMTARRKNNIAKRGGIFIPDDENSVVRLSDIDSRWIFPNDASASADVNIEGYESDVSLTDYLQQIVHSMISDVSDMSDSKKIAHMDNLMSIGHAMADCEHTVDKLHLPDVQMSLVKTKGRPSSKKISSDKTVADKVYADCLKRDAQAKRKTTTQVNSAASTSASAKKPRHCSTCKQPGHDTRRCPNQNSNSA
ncbi:hypothetical protein COEREDRAFT_11594 [Coemansia reversa NRRL 1564]|uniref:SWIM-type domain-containing protein n=1 Tax=Coemansia reversa (strain ATCC 12441 / NRRL 1564) TaxID=763665 RepID=A0A2G5B2T8_COERN|nr:hypothetical protein COEREDRAFT_11594 [Coemansia reversa NRRL 1564]|eukprot:PIA13301.1 hypothetical protein COEREDRAFT_11594 [Coemansia reversa NRRL 1564]